MQTVTGNRIQPILAAAILAIAAASTPSNAWALPMTGCAINILSTTVLNDCTLVETPETGEPGSAETLSAKFASPSGLARANGFVPIFESASGIPKSIFDTSSNPAGVVGAVSDYLIITGGSDITLASDGFSASLLAGLLKGLTQLQPVAADGKTPIMVAEPAEGILDQAVEFYLPVTTSFSDHFVVYSDVSAATPEPSPALLLAAGLVCLSYRVRNRLASCES